MKCLHVYTTLHGHTDRVNCVHWITTRSSKLEITEKRQRELVSGAADSCVCVWKETKEEEVRKLTSQGVNLKLTFSPLLSTPPSPLGQFSLVEKLSGHSQPVTCVAATYQPMANGNGSAVSTTMASSSSDSTVVVWRRESPEGRCDRDWLRYGNKSW